MNVSQTDLGLSKLKVFKNANDIAMDSIINQFNKINNCFSTNNKRKFVSLEQEIKNKFNVLNNIYNNNYRVINTNKLNYIETSTKVKNMFKNDIIR